MSDVSLLGLFLAFLRLGATAYGGPAIMARLRHDLVERRHWITDDDFGDGVALCQVLPGATWVQMCAYVGYRLRGPAGALVAAVAFVLPAFMAILLLSALYFRSASVPVIQALFHGLSAVVVAIVFNGALTLVRTTVRDRQGVVIALLALSAMLLRANFMMALAGAAGLAIVLYGAAGRRAHRSTGGTS